MATTNLATQIMIIVLMFIGSTTLVSVVPMLIRSVILRRHLREENPRAFHIEQSAMHRLAVLVPVYMLVNILVGFLASGFYTQFTSDVKPTLQEAGVNPWYASLFIAVRHCCTLGSPNDLLGRRVRERRLYSVQQ